MAARGRIRAVDREGRMQHRCMQHKGVTCKVSRLAGCGRGGEVPGRRARRVVLLLLIQPPRLKAAAALIVALRPSAGLCASERTSVYQL